MSETKTLDYLKELLNGEITDSGYKLDCDFLEVSGEDYLKIVAVDYEKYPVMARVENFECQKKNSRIMFQVNLFNENELNKAQQNELNKEFLTVNSIIDLSSVSIANGVYILFGELSATSNDEDILIEIDTLLNNLMNALDDLLERVENLGDYKYV